MKKYRSERKGRRSFDTALHYNTLNTIATEKTRTAKSAVGATCSAISLNQPQNIIGVALAVIGGDPLRLDTARYGRLPRQVVKCMLAVGRKVKAEFRLKVLSKVL